MKTIKEFISYQLEWRSSDRSLKTWPFTDLKSAQEIFEEKADEGKRPKLFLIRQVTTKEQVYVK